MTGSGPRPALRGVPSSERRKRNRWDSALREIIRELQTKGEYEKLMALELMYVKGWRNQDVAARLTMTEQDVANLRFQAKKRLRDRLTASKLSPDLFPELQG